MYVAVINASFRRLVGRLAPIMKDGAFRTKIPPDRSNPPFCSGVYGAVRSCYRLIAYYEDPEFIRLRNVTRASDVRMH